MKALKKITIVVLPWVTAGILETGETTYYKECLSMQGKYLLFY